MFAVASAAAVWRKDSELLLAVLGRGADPPNLLLLCVLLADRGRWRLGADAVVLFVLAGRRRRVNWLNLESERLFAVALIRARRDISARSAMSCVDIFVYKNK